MLAPDPPSAGDPSPPRHDAPGVDSARIARRIRSAAVTVLALLAPLAVLLVAFAWESRPALTFGSGTITGPEKRPKAITLPYTSEHEPGAAKYRYDLRFVALPSRRSLLRIVPDDCVRSLSVNGTAISLAAINSSRLCDFRSGFDIDVGPSLRTGDNEITLEVENVSGPHGLAVRSIRNGAPLSAGSIALLVLLVPACFVAVRGARLGQWQRWVAATLLALAGWIRYRYVFDWHPPDFYVFSDMGGYVDHAREILRGSRDENLTFQPIGYPMILALSLRLLGDFTFASWVHVLCGWGTVVLMWRASARWFRPSASLWVLGLAAFHLPFIALSGFFLAETFFTFQLALLFYCLARFAFPWRAGRGFVVGLVYMSAVWVKGNNTLFGPLAIAWIALWVLSHHRVEWARLTRRVLPGVAAFCVAATLVVASHAAFTYAHDGHARMSASTAGLNLVEGKCPSKRNFDTAGYGWQSPLFVQLGENEEKHWPRPFTDQSYFWAAGVQCIRQNPAVLLTSLRYVYYLFFDNQLWPPNTSQDADLVRAYGMLYSAFLFPCILLGVVVVGRRPRGRLALASVIGLSIIVCSWLFKSELRYRIPFDVAFIPLAAIGAGWAFARLRRRRRAEPAPSTA